MTNYGYTIGDTDGHTYSFIFPEEDKRKFECHLPVPLGQWGFMSKWHVENHPDWKCYIDNEEHPLVVEKRLTEARREMEKQKQLQNYHPHSMITQHTRPTTLAPLIKICDDCHTETLGYGNEEHFNGAVLCHWCLELRLITDTINTRHPPKRPSHTLVIAAYTTTILFVVIALIFG